MLGPASESPNRTPLPIHFHPFGIRGPSSSVPFSLVTLRFLLRRPGRPPSLTSPIHRLAAMPEAQPGLCWPPRLARTPDRRAGTSKEHAPPTLSAHALQLGAQGPAHVPLGILPDPCGRVSRLEPAGWGGADAAWRWTVGGAGGGFLGFLSDFI